LYGCKTWAGYLAAWENSIQNLIRKCEGKRPCRRPRHRREDIKMDLREIM